ncbi:MAG: NUDIX domain-containing protein [Candidatus Aenigmarchaeota archaeon]|nr:NUDIX domain-containing protein [Candidatus Aenigmarchaeota archaeon]
MPLTQHATVAILIERRGKILLIRRGYPPEKGFWALPAGHVDPGETPWQTAVREAREEIGETVVERKPLLRFAHDARVDHRHRATVFRGRLVGEPRAGSDAAAAQFFRRSELPAMEITHYTNLILNALRYGKIRG